MNFIVKDTILNFFSKHDVVIEGKGKKTWGLEGFSLSLKKQPLKYFILLVADNADIDWFLHFENYTETPYTSEELYTLFSSVAEIIDKGQKISSEGGITPGGISAFKHMYKFGFKKIGEYKGDKVYWSDSLTDRVKFNKWLLHASPEEYEKINKDGWTTFENTRPVLPVLVKTI